MEDDYRPHVRKRLAALRRHWFANGGLEISCGGSRHVRMIAEGLLNDGEYPMLAEDPVHCAGSMVSTVDALYRCRAALHRHGIHQFTDSIGRRVWRKGDPESAHASAVAYLRASA